MPANLTPEYLAAEASFKAARELPERIEALEEMLRVIPKHKGTDHLRGDLRRKLSELREDQKSAAKRGGARRADPGYVPRQGAGQAVLLGPANVGKSALLAALTRAEPEVAPYPYTTRKPLPGMMQFEDAQIQLVDAPAIEPDVYEPWMNSLVRNANLGLVVLDPAHPGVLGTIDEVQALIGRGRVKLCGAWWALGEGAAPAQEQARAGQDAGRELGDDELLARLDPGDVELPVLVLVNKLDLEQNRAELGVLSELLGPQWPLVPVSAQSGEGLDRLRELCFRALKVIRVYAKPPGKPASTETPIILPLGATVLDMARTIHKELARDLRFARIWSGRHFEGQRAARDAVLHDRDIVEINA
ncbi:MAG: 50S ribosome-binding GTPase [Deltaproteobacteria bacterium]|nr:50S ribosome-binding GTPase [Deltaproteobacteria bacterium]